MKKRIFLTGGMGFIGSAVIDKLAKLGHETASYDASLNFIKNDQYYRKCLKLRREIYKQPSKIYEGDIRDIENLTDAIQDFSPEIVIHLAGLAMARPLKDFEEQMIPINLIGTLNVLEAFEKSTAEKIVYTSSSMAYGHFIQTPQSENCMLNPINSYGACKAAGEYFVKLSKKKWIIIRPTSVYGFTDCANRISQLLIDAAYLKKKIWVINGETLDFSYIDDVAEGFTLAILNEKANFDTYNISRGESRSTIEYAEIVKKDFPDFTCDVKEPDTQQVFRGPQEISKAKKILNFSPKYSLEAGIKKIIELNDQYSFYEN